jgi:polar amino acid transport system ATP-binding protein
MTMSFSLPLVKMQALHKSYGDGAVQVLKGIDIEMKPGDRVVVIGPSGGGKSTLLRVMMGLEQIDSGTVSFDGKAVHLSDGAVKKTVIDTNVRRSIGMVFQHYTLFPHLNVMQNLMLAPCKVRGEAEGKSAGPGAGPP